MDSTEQVLPEPTAPGRTRASSVYMGRQDYTSVTLRLIVMELYKLRRRAMSKVLIICTVVATVGLYLLIVVAGSLISRGTTSSEVIANFTSPLRLPQSLFIAVQLLLSLGAVLIIILVSTVVGGEYSAGTVRLMLTRGPTRTQIFWSKVGMSFICIVIGVISVALLGVVSGLLFNLTTGITATFDFLSAAWFGHAFLYILLTVLGLFMPAMLALFLATVGRATAAGLAGALTWSFFIEPIIEVISPFGRAISGPIGDFFQSLPNYLIGPNITTLLNDQYQFLAFGGQSSSPTPTATGDLQAMVVLTVYLVLFIGVAWWVSLRRDITN